MSEPTTTGTVRRKSKIYLLSMTAVMTAVICVLAPMSIPIGVVPVSFTNFAIYLSLYLLGWKLGTVSYVVYMLIGMVGMPVFSGYTGGLGKLLGPTGGYIIGFIPLAIIAGLVIEKSDNRLFQFLAMVVGTAVCYAFGTAWFCFSMDATVAYALGICVFPFIPFDIAKMVVAMIVGPMVRSRLVKARLMD
jgi:biotin transport system substrate-specific component